MPFIPGTYINNFLIQQTQQNILRNTQKQFQDDNYQKETINDELNNIEYQNIKDEVLKEELDRSIDMANFMIQELRNIINKNKKWFFKVNQLLLLIGNDKLKMEE